MSRLQCELSNLHNKNNDVHVLCDRVGPQRQFLYLSLSGRIDDNDYFSRAVRRVFR